MFQALELLTVQVQNLASHQAAGGSKKKWDSIDKYRNIKVFSGDAKEYEEFAMKLHSQVAAGDPKVERMMQVVENDCTEDQLARGKYDECNPEFDANDEDFIITSSSEMYNLLLNMTTGEANAMIRRCRGQGWLAWKKLTSSLNPRTLASGIKAISSVLSPGKVNQATKADNEIEQWEDRVAKLHSEYGQDLSAKMKVAVLYSMLPKDLQERVIDECAVNWDETPEETARVLFVKIKNQIKNIAKSRREMSGPKPMEVDAVMDWSEWSSWGQQEGTCEHSGEKEGEHEEAYVQYIGKGGKKGGKGFQGRCYACGEFGHSQWECPNMKGKGKGKSSGKGKGEYVKGYGKEANYGKWYGKDSDYGKGYGKDSYYHYGSKGKGGDQGKGVTSWMPKACFACGSTEHLLRDCPKNQAKVQNVADEGPEVLFIGNVVDREQNKGDAKERNDEWRQVPKKVKLNKCVKSAVHAPCMKTPVPEMLKNPFKVLEVEEDDEQEEMDVMYIRTVQGIENQNGWDKNPGNNKKDERIKDKASIKFRDTANIEEPKQEGSGDVKYVQSVVSNGGDKKGEWCSLGVGDIVIDSAADESCWPVGQGDAFPTVASNRNLMLKTANGGDMRHYGQKEVLFKCGDDVKSDPLGLIFQVTDVRKPLLAVRRLVERGNQVVLASGDGESYVYNTVNKTTVPVKKKGGSFVIEAQFVKQMPAPSSAAAQDFARQA